MKNIKLKFLTLALVAVITAISAISKLPAVSDRNADSAAQLTFVDVGQGDCIFLKLPQGETWLIDGGEADMFEARLSRFLRLQMLDKIDYALVTHYHADHIGGIMELLNSERIENLLLPDYTPENKTKDKLLKAAKLSETKVIPVSAGYTHSRKEQGFELALLHPQKGGFSDNENSNSAVAMLHLFNTDILLTGDLEADGEASVLNAADLEADILKVGHHGSYTSTSAEFLKEVDPTYAVIQCGEDNPYGHPHYETLEALENDDVLIYRTDTDGSITFTLSENGIDSIRTSEN